MKERLDQVLVLQDLAKTRSQAAHLIREGVVRVDGEILTKAGHKVNVDCQIELARSTNVVGRGAYKLDQVIKDLAIQLNDLVIIDVGASTGGFTQICLREGAKKVYCVDVGTGQLDPLLLANPRVVNLEGQNIKELKKLDQLADFAVVDLSFISLRQVLESIFDLLNPNSKTLVLFKPQFEIGKHKLPHDGVVKNELDLNQCLDDFKIFCQQCFINILGEQESSIKGKKGNREFFFILQKGSNRNE